MRRALAEAGELLGSDPLELEVPPGWADRLGHRGPVTYRAARRAVTPELAGVFVGAVLALYSDERVQGRHL